MSLGLNLVLVVVVLYGHQALARGSALGRVISWGLVAGGLIAVIVHTYLLPNGGQAFRLPASITPSRRHVFPFSNASCSTPVGTWAFVLDPISELTTWMIISIRSEFDPTLLGLVSNKYGLEIPHLVMGLNTMLGIRSVRRIFMYKDRGFIPASFSTVMLCSVGVKLERMGCPGE